MTEELDSRIVEAPEIALKPFKLPKDEPKTDQGFITPDGTKLRVRVIRVGEAEATAPVRGGAAIAPLSITLSITIAKMDDDLGVAKNGAGQLLISNRHEYLISLPAMENPDHNLKDEIDRLIRQRAYVFETWAKQQVGTEDYLSKVWGG